MALIPIRMAFFLPPRVPISFSGEVSALPCVWTAGPPHFNRKPPLTVLTDSSNCTLQSGSSLLCGKPHHRLFSAPISTLTAFPSATSCRPSASQARSLPWPCVWAAGPPHFNRKPPLTVLTDSSNCTLQSGSSLLCGKTTPSVFFSDH